ncbi:MAG TPA: CapA family protein [Patescibacteria group bacterium]|nr:CapA family protein [Patescibacteria group bacterium]
MKPKKRLLIILVIIFILAGGLIIWKNSQKTDSTDTLPTSNQTVKKPPKEDPSLLRIIGTGDMLPHETVNQQAKSAGGYDYRQFFDQVKKYYQSADVRFCNQESPSAPDIGVTAYPTFNAPTQFASDLSATGCNVISLANNHLNDRGQSGIDGTRAVWDGLKPLGVAGANRSAAEKNKVSYFEVKGVKMAFVAYTEISNSRSLSSYGLNMLNDNLVKSQLGEAKTQADIIIVSVHWGTEYNPSVNSAQQRWAKTFADNGADIVFGTGPHVLQPVQRLTQPNGEETVVFYSLGNILSSQLDVESLIGGFGIVDIDPTTKKIRQTAFLPTYMHYEWTPQQKAREDLLARKNLKIYTLDQSAEPLSRSQNNTTVDYQTKRITDLLNKFTPVKILKSNEY